MNVEVSAVVIAYNSAATIRNTIEDLEDALRDLNSEILVIDNDSADETVEIASSAIQTGRVIANHENAGYARAANLGLRAAAGRLTLVMNDDARLEPGAIDRLIEVVDSSPEVALVGPRIIDESGEPAPSARAFFPGPQEEWIRLRDLITRNHNRTRYPALDRPTRVQWLIGACVLGPTELLRKVGGFNEEFFLYGEDIDLGRRLWALDYQSVTVPDALCIHEGGATTSKTYTSRIRTERQVSGRSVYYRIWVSRPFRSLIYLRRAIGLRGQPARLKLFLSRAIWDGPSLRKTRFPPPMETARAERVDKNSAGGG